MVPVIALVEGVVFAVNASQPELVLREELAKAPLGWNGRPVCGGHPHVDGKPVPANSPAVLERDAFGFLAHTEVREDRLYTEAYIDPTMARPGSIAEGVVRRLQAGQPIEVSVGTFMEVERREGVYMRTGQKYYGIWRNLVPDHLAMLDEGDVGACSIQDGCGAMRTAAVHIVTDSGLLVPSTSFRAAEEKPMSLLDKIFGGLKGKNFRSADSMSDDELRYALEGALRDVEPGFLGTGPIYPEENEVIYAVQLTDSPVQLFRRGYSVKEDKSVTLKDKRTEVRQETQYVPVDASAHPSESRTACGCQKNRPVTASGEQNTMDKTARINALIASGRFVENDRAWLNTVPEDRLATLEAQQPTAPQSPPAQPSTPPSAPAPAPSQPTTPPAAPEQPAPAPTTASAATFDQFLELAPPQFRKELKEMRAASENLRTAAITQIKAAGARNQFSDEELAAMELPQLQKIAAMIATPTVASAPRLVDFSARGLPGSQANEDPNTVPEPPSLVSSIRTARGQQS